MLKIANQVIDEIAILLMQMDHISPECIARLSLDTDLRECMRMSNLQIRLFKNKLKEQYDLPFDRLQIEREKLPLRDVITYIIVYSDDERLYQWQDASQVA